MECLKIVHRSHVRREKKSPSLVLFPDKMRCGALFTLRRRICHREVLFRVDPKSSLASRQPWTLPRWLLNQERNRDLKLLKQTKNLYCAGAWELSREGSIMYQYQYHEELKCWSLTFKYSLFLNKKNGSLVLSWDSVHRKSIKLLLILLKEPIKCCLPIYSECYLKHLRQCPWTWKWCC